MAQKVEILNLDINTSALISKMTETRTEIERLKSVQKSLENSNQSNSDSFTRNAVAIGRLQSSYNQQKSVVAQLTTVNNSFATASNAITQSINQENTTIAAARENNKQLLTLRNQLNLSTSEGQAALQNINAKLDQNNAFIKENVSAYEQQKIGIGDYRSAIVGAIGDTGLFGGQIQGIKQALGSFTPLLSTMKNEFNAGASQIRNSAQATEGMTLAQKALTVATGVGTGAMRIFTVALAATGIGLIIAAVALLIGYLKGFTPIVDKVEQAMAGLGAVFNIVQKGVAEFVMGLSDLGNTIKKVGAFLADPIKGFKELGNAMGEAYDASANLKKAQQDLDDVIISSGLNNDKLRSQINLLNIQAKDRTKTEAERIAALEKADAIEKQIYQSNKKIADEKLAQAQEEIRIAASLTAAEFKELQKRGFAYKEFVEQRAKNVDELFDDKLVAALKAQTDSQNEYYVNLEKSSNKQNKLIEAQEEKKEKAAEAAEAALKKRAEAQAKIVDAAIQKNKEEIDLYVASQGIKKKSLEDELAFEESLLNKRLELLKREFQAKKISEIAYQTESLKLKNDFAKKQVDATVANAAKELEYYKLLNQQKKDEDKFFSDEKLIQRQNENLALQLEEIKFQEVRLQQGVINQQQFNDAIDAINANTRLKNDEAEKLRAEAEKEKQAIDLENKIATQQLNSENEFAFRAEEIERNRLAEVAAAEKTGADVGLINSKFAAQKKALDKSIADFKLNQELQIVQGLKGLFGEQTALGKAAAIAEIGITTYSKASAAFAQAALFAANPVTLPLAANAKVQGGVIIATGALQAAKVAGVKFADGGQVPTLGSGVINNGANLSIPLSNGDDTLAYVGQGEVILNKQQQAAAGGSQFFKSIGVPGFNGGGFVGGNSNLGTQRGQKIDLELMASLISQANRNLPTPVVSVSEIAEVGNRVAVYESGANF